MTLVIAEQYETKPARYEVIEVTADNLFHIAELLSAGSIEVDFDNEHKPVEIRYIFGPNAWQLTAKVGSYVMRLYEDDGARNELYSKYRSLSKELFEHDYRKGWS